MGFQLSKNYDSTFRIERVDVRLIPGLERAANQEAALQTFKMLQDGQITEQDALAYYQLQLKETQP